jgi:hypothetical protein
MLASEYRVGIAVQVITPRQPIYMSGYAARSHPSDGVLQDIKAKAMVIRDKGGAQAAIVTMDLIGMPRALADIVGARVEKQYGVPRAQLLLNCSHTHTGPLVGHNLGNLFALSTADRQVVEDYTRDLADKLVDLVGAAAGKLEPADLWFGNGQAHFGINRRQGAAGAVKIGLNPQGPTDPDVPVLKVTAPDGTLRAVLFGYACHNTTLTAEFYQISGDYAGFAQSDFEAAHPGATAMFMQLCGADQNPNPRSEVEHARAHGKTLAAEVGRVIDSRLTRVSGPVRAAFQTTDLRFAHHTRSTFEAQLADKNVYRARNAQKMLQAYDEKRPMRTYPYPVQAIAFGKSLTLVALGGEVVIDYDLRIKKEYGEKGLIVAGYSNDVMSYIPSARVLKEGGYEADDSMIYYGMPGRYSDEVETQVMDAVHQVMARVGRKAR